MSLPEKTHLVNLRGKNHVIMKYLAEEKKIEVKVFTLDEERGKIFKKIGPESDAPEEPMSAKDNYSK